MIKLVFLGAPGAGKGTQSQLISKMLSIPKLSTGDMLRRAIEEKSDVGQKVSALMAKGLLVSDNIVSELVENRIKSFECSNGFILDGYPRNLSQAIDLDKMVSQISDTPLIVINLNVEESELVNRIAGRFSCKACGASFHKQNKKPLVDGICDNCGSHEFIQRPDDSEIAVKTRLKLYKDQTMPLIDYYNKTRSLIDIDGKQDINRITALIFDNYSGLAAKDLS